MAVSKQSILAYCASGVAFHMIASAFNTTQYNTLYKDIFFVQLKLYQNVYKQKMTNFQEKCVVFPRENTKRLQLSSSSTFWYVIKFCVLSYHVLCFIIN
jgi:hypothetical protein